MPEKKSFKLECGVCDARKMREDRFEGYEDIRIDAAVLIANENSSRIMERYPIHLNVEDTIETESEVDIQIQNGTTELGAGQLLERDAILIVNGTLTIAPGTEELLKKYVSIIVNGTVKYPRSLAPYLTKMRVNGTTNAYPDDCILLKRNAVIDGYFPLRAKQNARYYAERRVILVDGKADVKALVEKGVYFETQELLVAESLVKDAVALIGDETTLMVVPDGCAFINDDVTLDEALVRKYGTKLYINGNLSLEKESTSCISKVEYLHVNGDVELYEEQRETFLAINVEYNNLKIRKGKSIQKQLKVYVDAAMLANAPEGICLQKCIEVTLDEKITPEQIRDFLKFEKCVEIICTKEQQGAVSLVGEKTVNITTDKEGREEKKEKFDGVSIQAETYVL